MAPTIRSIPPTSTKSTAARLTTTVPPEPTTPRSVARHPARVGTDARSRSPPTTTTTAPGSARCTSTRSSWVGHGRGPVRGTWGSGHSPVLRPPLPPGCVATGRPKHGAAVAARTGRGLGRRVLRAEASAQAPVADLGLPAGRPRLRRATGSILDRPRMRRRPIRCPNLSRPIGCTRRELSNLFLLVRPGAGGGLEPTTFRLPCPTARQWASTTATTPTPNCPASAGWSVTVMSAPIFGFGVHRTR